MSTGKRAIDIVASAAGLIALGPLLGLVAVCIKLGDRGPVFYSQTRVGRGGRAFRLLKFRTMSPGSDRQGLLTIGQDTRITPVGRWLRAWKLDELPQLVNVLRGEMSLVGPRPEVPRYVELYDEGQRRVLELTPGITDPASILYSRESELLAKADDAERTYVCTIMPEKLRINLEYAARATVLTDVLVVFRTIGVVARPNADSVRSGRTV